jgi:hypothetical protein
VQGCPGTAREPCCRQRSAGGTAWPRCYRGGDSVGWLLLVLAAGWDSVGALLLFAPARSTIYAAEASWQTASLRPAVPGVLGTWRS